MNRLLSGLAIFVLLAPLGACDHAPTNPVMREPGVYLTLRAEEAPLSRSRTSLQVEVVGMPDTVGTLQGSLRLPKGTILEFSHIAPGMVGALHITEPGVLRFAVVTGGNGTRKGSVFSLQMLGSVKPQQIQLKVEEVSGTQYQDLTAQHVVRH